MEGFIARRPDMETRFRMSNYRKFFVKRAFWYLLTFLVALALNFFLPRLMPGNPVDLILAQFSQSGGANVNTMRKLHETFMAEWNLDKPLLQQFILYAGNLFRGDLGTSFTSYPTKVADILARAIPWTLALQIPAILAGWFVGNTLGAIVGFRNGAAGKIVYPLSLFINCIPYYAFALILMYVFGVVLRWFPQSGGYSPSLIPGYNAKFIWDVVRHHTLPFLAISLVMIGGQAIGMRSMAIYEKNTDYVLYAKLMGIRDKTISRYVFRNAMLPQISGLALSLGTMVSGSLITELVFNYPGLGFWLFSAIRQSDYPLISGCTLIISVTVLVMAFLLDVVYGLVDPRIKATQMEEG